MYSQQYTIGGLELDQTWTKNVGPSINIIEPSGYDILYLPSSMKMICDGPAYGGWLAKHVATMMYNWPNIAQIFKIKINDEALKYGQVIETDLKPTDTAGWTYPGDFQINISKNWMIQIGNPWVDTGTLIAPFIPDQWNTVEIDREFDYVNHQTWMTGLIVNNKSYPVVSTKYAATQAGWAVGTLVTQFEQCIAGLEGGYELEFQSVGYSCNT